MDTVEAAQSRLDAGDSNGDGVVSADDADFSALRAWQDVNGNGVSEAGEMKTLAELDIESITVAAIASGDQVAGNLIGHAGTHARADGSTETRLLRERDVADA